MNIEKYNPAQIETKWQKYWEENGTYTADLSTTKPKFVGFGMFNYPSGAGIHVGHVKNFTLPDVLIRAKRQQGFESYSPVGFDSFGLPAENYAIKTGQSPRKTTDDAIANYRKQYKAVGFSFDWSKEIDTSQEEYYKWTQWCFIQLHKHGLAYQKQSMQWWCDQCKTVLADEQVIGGKCWRHNSDSDPFVGKKSLKQWFFKITDYADEILEATDALNWTPWVKTAQKNWIGKSEGAEIDWLVCNAEGDETGSKLTTFTTRTDTIPGVTFLVIAPESNQVNDITHPSKQEAIEKYKQQVALLSDLERLANKDKSGEFTGSYAKNPLNNNVVPIYVASYVLNDYGTGVVMGMGGHDLRDREFAIAHSLPIIFTTQPPENYTDTQSLKVWGGEGEQINSGDYDGLSNLQAAIKIFDYLASNQSARSRVTYKIRDWLISRQRYWGAPIPVIYCAEHGAVPVPESQLPVELPEVEDYKPSGDGRSPLANVTDWVNAPCPVCGKMGTRETDTMDGYVCSSWYQLRYMDPKNEMQAWNKDVVNKWMPVDFYNGADHATAHLLYARFFTRFFYKLGLVNNPEPFNKMYLHAKILAPDGTAFSKSKGNGIDPLQVINSGYGADALRTYIMFMAPPDVETAWNDNGVQGCFRFMNRIWNLTHEYLENKSSLNSAPLNEEILRSANKMVKKVTEDIEATKLNTAISSMMEYLNELYKFKQADNFSSESWEFAIKSLVQCIAPFAPHIAEELWHKLGNSASIHVNNWPTIDERYLQSEFIQVPVQVKGKFKNHLLLSANSTLSEIEAKLKEAQIEFDPSNQKIIYVPNKIINIVIK